MNKKLLYLAGLIFSLVTLQSNAAPDRTQLVVWANEAIIATYTYNYKNFVQEQTQIAKYFTAEGWIAYSKALNASKLPEAVQKNLYDVTAVATQPPILVTLDPTHWIVSMPILVVYKNPQYQQQQNLKISLGFSLAPDGEGVRGFSASSLQATVIKPPCQCPNEDDVADTPAAAATTTTPTTTTPSPTKP